jgi:hypothetical protein
MMRKSRMGETDLTGADRSEDRPLPWWPRHGALKGRRLQVLSQVRRVRKNAVGGIPVFLQKSAEVIANAGDGLRFGGEKCRK